MRSEVPSCQYHQQTPNQFVLLYDSHVQAASTDSALNEEAECENTYIILLREYSFLGCAVTKTTALSTGQLLFSLFIDEESKD